MTKTEARPALLQARGIVKTIQTGAGELKILKGVDLDLRPGELTLLMGPSGSGKTTLLSILGCILTATSGQLKVNGEEAVGQSAEGLADIRRRNIGFVFQGYNLFPTLTAVENVLMALDVRGTRLADPMATSREALVSVGLSHRVDAFPSKLSGGEKQRVAIARSLAGSPAVVLADEPTAALDSENGKAVMELLAHVAQDPTRAVLAVTHDHRTLGYADRIIRIEDGYIVADERPKEMRAAGLTPDHSPHAAH
jgi:putative ABC transport system ATP-binding protein